MINLEYICIRCICILYTLFCEVLKIWIKSMVETLWIIIDWTRDVCNNWAHTSIFTLKKKYANTSKLRISFSLVYGLPKDQRVFMYVDWSFFFILSIFKMQSSSILSPLIFVTSILISSNIVTSVYMRKIFLGLYFPEYSARSAYGIYIAKT